MIEMPISTWQHRALVMAGTLALLIGCGPSSTQPNDGSASGGAGGNSSADAGAGGSGGEAATGGASGTGCGDKCKLQFPDGTVVRTYACCNNGCADLVNDPLNCGACGNKCFADKPVCADSVCVTPTCNAVCATNGICCGGSCCDSNQLCCAGESADGETLLDCLTTTASQPTCAKRGFPELSDRNIKRAVQPVNVQQILGKVIEMPISTWQYRFDPDSVRHMGPMAQDFKQAFGLGDSDRTYYPVDAHGVTLASIQALARVTADQKEQIEALRRQNRALERRLGRLEAGRAGAP